MEPEARNQFESYDGRIISLPDQVSVEKLPTIGDAQRYCAEFRFRGRRWTHEIEITNRLIAESGPEVFLHQVSKSFMILCKQVETENTTCARPNG